MGELKGKFISIEGVDGCGKTTHAKLLSGWLRSKGYRVLVTDEPTDGAIGRVLKKSLQGRLKLPLAAEALLFAADRVQHVVELVKPALRAGKVVITERYLASSLAYQWARGLPLGWIKSINRGAPEPDLTIVIDLPPELALSRMRGGRRLDRFEADLSLQHRVRSNYLTLAKRLGFRVVDGARGVDEVQADIRKLVAKLLG